MDSYKNALALVSIKGGTAIDDADGSLVYRIVVKPKFSYTCPQSFDASEMFCDGSYVASNKEVNVTISFECVTDGMSFTDVCKSVELLDGAITADITTRCGILVYVSDNESENAVSSDAKLVRCVFDDRNEFREGRNAVLKGIVSETLRRMYAEAEPPVDYDELIELKKCGYVTDSQNDKVFNRHYLEKGRQRDIFDEVCYEYGMDERVKNTLGMLVDGFKEGLYLKMTTEETKELEVPSEVLELTHGYGRLRPLKDMIGDENAEKVISLVERFKSSHGTDRDKDSVMSAVFLGPSPSSNKETVEEYYKSLD